MKGKIKAVEGLQTKSEVSKFAIFFFFFGNILQATVW